MYILRWIRGPNKFLSWSKTLVPQRHSCVNDVLSVTTNHNKSAKRDKLNGVEDALMWIEQNNMLEHNVIYWTVVYNHDAFG